jgi:hypothetical protein
LIKPRASVGRIPHVLIQTRGRASNYGPFNNDYQHQSTGLPG